MQYIHRFSGVYSSNELIPPVAYPTYIIANFPSSNENGTHFIAILFVNKDMCIYFDPLNLSFIPKNIQEYMRVNSRFVYQINYTIQNPFSNLCGSFCILCIMMHVNNTPLIQGIASFREASEQNDNKFIRMLEKLFKLYYLEQFWQSKIINNGNICIY